MHKKNFTSKNNLDANLIFKDILKIYQQIEKIKKKNDENIAGVLFHELIYFFVSNKCRANLKFFFKIINKDPVIKFGKRKNKDIFKLKKNSFLILSLFKIYNLLTFFLKFKKTLFLGKSISLSFKNKIFLIIFCLLKKYKIVLVNFEDIQMNLSNYTELYFLKEIKKLLIKYKISLKNLNDIKNLINKVKKKKKFKFKNTQRSIIISGTLADIQNRLLAIKKVKINAKLLVVNHISTYGVVSFKTLKFDEFFLCDYYITPGKKKKTLNYDDNYTGIDNENIKIISIQNKQDFYFSNYVKKINFKKLKKNRILYVPNRAANASLNGKDYIHTDHYQQWQNFLATKFGKIDAKYPYKKITYNINFKFNVLNANLKLLEICNNYDLIIIDFISSSTFSEIASTNVPILYFNINRDQINKEASKIINDRVTEIKINVLDNFKGFEKVNKLTKINKKKNTFTSTYLNVPIKKSFYQNLLNIDEEFKI